jgi:DNA topoisomerase-3
MRAAEHLYLSGYLSYPRTESSAYPSSYDFRETLSALREHWDLGDYAGGLLRAGYTSPRAGTDAGDHPPITPVSVPGGPHLLGGSDEARLYDMVVRHFLASISPDEVYEQTKATFEATCGETFTVVGRRQLDPGYTAVYGSSRRAALDAEEMEPDEDADGEDGSDRNAAYSELPSSLTKGVSCKIVALKVRQGQTKPPGPLTESELISLMEKNGIGTDASIPTHINNILVRNYVTLGSGRTLIPTPLGVVLVHGYLKIDPDLVLPEIRCAVETFCNLIAKGQAEKNKVNLICVGHHEL